MIEGLMWRDRWCMVGVLGSLLTCLAYATPIAAVLVGAIDLGAWAGPIDLVLFPVLGAVVILAASATGSHVGG